MILKIEIVLIKAIDYLWDYSWIQDTGSQNWPFDIFGEKFKVSKDLVYSYVKAVIVTKLHSLQIYLGDDLVDTFEYRLTT